mgnify:CR=1 FL=1
MSILNILFKLSFFYLVLYIPNVNHEIQFERLQLQPKASYHIISQQGSIQIDCSFGINCNIDYFHTYNGGEWCSITTQQINILREFES